MRPEPSYRLLCVMTHHVIDRLGTEAEASRVIDELKWDLARAHLASPQPHIMAGLYDAVSLARRKGYRTPQRGER